MPCEPDIMQWADKGLSMMDTSRPIRLSDAVLKGLEIERTKRQTENISQGTRTDLTSLSDNEVRQGTTYRHSKRDFRALARRVR